MTAPRWPRAVPGSYNDRVPRALKISGTKVSIAEPSHLCGVQRTTRALCRAAGFDESAVFQAVIAVTDFAYRLFLERSERVDLRLSAQRGPRRDELLAQDAGAGQELVRVSFPHA